MPSPWITRMVRDEDGSVANPKDFAPEWDGQTGLYPVVEDQCQHVVCRVREDRQDLQCQRLQHGPEIRHLHTVALGWCSPKWPNLPSAEGRTGGHTNPAHRA